MNRAIFALLPLLLAADWPAWRGPAGDGTTAETGFPTEWGPTRNVRWKVRLPGAGNGSPVVMGDDVVVTATDGPDHSELHVLCFDRLTGRAKWRRDLTGTPADAPFSMFPPERGHAACTPVLTADGIFALFGTGDLVKLDRAGRLLWARSLAADYGPIRNDYGLAASPLVSGGLVVVQVDHLGGSYILAADAATGATRWKADRPWAYDNWSSPRLARFGGAECVVALGTKRAVGYDLATGKELWTVGGLERLCSQTPLFDGDRLIVASGPAGATLALDLSVSPPKVAWQRAKSGAFVPSGVVAGGLLFAPSDQGQVTCTDVATGKELWKERFSNGRMRPSPVAAGGNVYVPALDGVTTVVRASGEFEAVAKNALGEELAASPALAGGCVFLRGDKHLWCIGE